MCGRYYVDDDTAKEIEKLVRQAEEKSSASQALKLLPTDIHPTQTAPVLAAVDKGSRICCRMQRWGFLVPGGKKTGGKLIFNARSETAAEQRMFFEAVACRRAVIPATWFYEWNRNKEKNIFYRKEKKVLFMAGIYNLYPDGEHFVILTTRANESMEPVHSRMPLLLEEEEILPWIVQPDLTQDFLRKIPNRLERRFEYEQISLF
ncbi:MAG: SOS response-associated peptidase [Lachnospiraceae bacterium]|nr:SOS response-associated peptidase [Lachnospiraceae bacterium]